MGASAEEPKAQATIPRVRIQYSAPAACPDEAAFLTSLTTQAHRFERAPRSAARVRLLDVSIVSRASEYFGTLRVREAGGSVSERDVRGNTCAEVFSALALVSAITIDSGPSPPNPPPVEPPRTDRIQNSPTFVWSTSVHGGIFTTMAPGPSFGVLPSLELSPPIRSIPVRFHFSVALAASLRADTLEGSTEFFWTTFRLGASVFSLSFGPFLLRPTVDIGAGFLRGRGLAIATPRDRLRPWADVMLGARLEWPIVPTFGIELSGSAILPITRPTWVFDSPTVVLHETPPIGGVVTLGGRFTFAQ